MDKDIVKRGQLLDFHKTINTVIIDLEELVNLTEEKYSYIYDTLPDCEREVNLSVEEIEILLNRLIFNNNSVINKDQSVITDTLSKILREFEQVTETFLNQDLISLLFRTFLDKSGSDEQSFYELIKMSQEVDEALSVLRDLALNSIVYSIRIGEQGAAFQILSDRINQVSMELGHQFGSMKSTINHLNDWNEGFQKTLVEFIKYEEDLKSKYQDKFKAEFDKIGTILKTVCLVLRNNLDNTRAAFADVAQIMVMIQYQDIIRQNIENIVKCLRILLEQENYLRDGEMEKRLDYIIFADRVLEISKVLMSNIETSLNESLLGLGQLLAKMDFNMQDLESDAHQLAKLFAGEENDESSSYVLRDVFTTVMGQVVDLLYIKKHIDSKSNLLTEGTATFLELMESVEKELDLINREVRGLKKMRVLIKIELARIDLDKDLALNTIVNAIDQVVDTINGNQKLFSRLRNYFFKNIGEFSSAINLTESKLALSAGTLTGSKKKLNIAHGLARGAVLASGKEMKEIFKQLKGPLEHLSDTSSIEMLMLDTNEKINTIQREMREVQNSLFTELGITEWEEKEEDLKLLMEQFTCFVERKAMTSVTGNDERDIGGEGSDIVLF